MKKTLRNALALITTVFAFTLTACGEIDDNTTVAKYSTESSAVSAVTTTAEIKPIAQVVTTKDSSVAEVTTNETEPVKSEPAPVETTTVVEEPVSEPATELETKEYTDPEPPALELDCLANSHEISIDELPAEDKALFEEFMNTTGMHGRFYDHVELTADTPKCYFIPNEEFILHVPSYMVEEKSILLLCPHDFVEDYFSKNYIISWGKSLREYTLFRNFSNPDFKADDDPTSYLVIQDYQHLNLAGIPVFIQDE